MSRIVKNYEIRHVLGEGGMGTVFYAVDVQLRREVALKCLRPEVASNPGVMERFRNEAQAQAQLNHPNVAHLYEYFQFGSEHYMAMEFVNGSTLAKILRVKVRLPWEEAAAYGVQSLRGLEHAHKHGIIHRDIKPTNLILNQENQVKLTDFGIARVSGSSHATRDGVVIGTYEYISPEAAQAIPTTALSDLYSLGVVLFELIAGRLPFSSQSDYELLRVHAQAQRPSLRSFVKDVPAALDELVQRAMDRKPGRRFRSAEEMAEALQRCLEPAGNRTASLPAIKWLRSLVGERGPEDTPVPLPAAFERRRTDISQTCHRVEDLLEQHLWSEAGAALEAGLRVHPDEPDLIDLGSRLQRQRQQHDQAVGQQAELVGDLLRRGLPEEAMKLLDGALAMYPRATSLLDLKQECRSRLEAANTTAGELALIESRVDEMIAAGRFKEGEDYLLELIGHNRNQSELGKLLTHVLQARNEAEKRAAIRQVLGEAEKAAGMSQWERALAIVNEAFGRFPADPTLEQAKRDFEERWQAERTRQAVEALLGDARGLERSGSLEAAGEKLRDGVARFPAERQLREELARIDAAVERLRRRARLESAVNRAAESKSGRRWQEALDLLDAAAAADGPDPAVAELRAVIAAEFRAHQAVVNRLVSEGRQLIQQKRWEEAVLKLSPAASEVGNEQGLADLLQEAQRGFAAKRQAETIAQLRSEAENYVRENAFEAAIQVLLDAVGQYPEDAGLSTALSQTVFARDAHTARQKTSAALLRAASLRGVRDFENSCDTLRQALIEFPNSQELLTALEDCEHEWREFRRGRMIQDMSVFVGGELAAGRYPSALDRLATELAAWPGDAALLALDAKVRAEQRQAAVRQALAAVLADGSILEACERWADAAEAYQRALSEYPELEPEVRPRIEATLARDEAERRQKRLGALESDYARFIESESFEEAASVLQRARSEFPDEPRLYAWQEMLAREQSRAARTSAIAAVETQARNLLAGQSFEEASRVVAAAEGELGADPVFESLRAAIARAEQEHRTAIESALAAIQLEFDRANWEAAIASATACSSRFPTEPRFKTLLDQAVGHRDREKRSLETAQRVSQIRVLIADNAFDDAAVLLRRALRDDPEEPVLAQLGRELDQTRGVRSQLEQFAQDRKEVEELLRARDWEAPRKIVLPYLGIPATVESATQLLRSLEEQEAQYRQQTEAVETQARGLLASQRYEECVRLLTGAIVEYPEIPSFSAMLEEARDGLSLHRRTRLLDEARTVFEQKRSQEALAAVERALSEFPGDRALLELRSTVTVALRKAAVEAVAAQVKALIQSDDAFQGELVLLEGLRRFPDSDELTALRPNVDAARRSEWERKSRQASRVRALANIQQLLTDHKLAAAADAVRLFELEQGAGAESLKAAIDQQLQEIARVRADVAELSKTGRFPAAVEILERALRRFPGDDGLREDWTRLQAARAQQERQEAYARGRAEFNSLMRQAGHDEAIAEVQRLIALFPDDPALPQDLESARSAKRLASRRVVDPTGIRLRPEPPRVSRAAARLTRVAERTTAALARAREIRTRVSTTTRMVSGKSLARADEMLKGAGRWRWFVVAGVAVALGAIMYGVWSPSESNAPGLNIQPPELEFSFRQGGPEPFPQSIHVSISESRALWRITSSDRWLWAYPGALSQSGSFTVQVSPAGLAPSDYSGSLSLEGDRRVTSSLVRVRLHVLPAVAPAPRRSGPPNSATERKARPDQEDRDSSAQPSDRVNRDGPKPLPVPSPAAVSETAREEIATDCRRLGYRGLSAGELSWMGTLEPDQAVTIGRENTVLAGPVASVKGSPLPGCEVSVAPARSGITVTEPPAQANRFSRVTMKNTSSHPIMNPRLLWTIK